MIYYFSATGNSKWVADTLAKRLALKAQDIMQVDPHEDLADSDEWIGFVFPIHAWGVPQIMEDFIARFHHRTGFTFAIATCGANVGMAVKKLMEWYHLDSGYSVIMPSNYIIGEDVAAQSTIIMTLQAAAQRITSIAEAISAHRCEYDVSQGRLATLKSGLINYGFKHYGTSTKPFTVDPTKCDGCQRCVHHCPMQTITLVNGLPTWGDSCCQCLACINGCPHSAIDYGNKTKGRKRYRIDAYLDSIKK